MQRYIGVDLGGTKIAAACVDELGQIDNEIRIETSANEGREAVFRRIKEAISRVKGARGIDGIGVVIPGFADSNTGLVLSLTNIPCLNQFPLREELQKEFAVPVFVENDANASTWAEYHMGAGVGADPMIFITISTGIGSGVIIHNRLIQGRNGYAGECGHMVIDPRGWDCACGRKGCLEAVASGTAIARWAKQAPQKASFFRYALEQNREVYSEDVFRAWREGDPIASRIIQRVSRYLGIGFANMIHMFNPQKIVVGGGVSKMGEPFLRLIRQETAKELMDPCFLDTYEIVLSQLQERGGILGAAVWCKKGQIS